MEMIERWAYRTIAAGLAAALLTSDANADGTRRVIHGPSPELPEVVVQGDGNGTPFIDHAVAGIEAVLEREGAHNGARQEAGSAL